MKENRFVPNLIIITLLNFGLAPGIFATVCDDDPDAIDYEATVDINLLNALLDLLGEIPVEYTYERPINNYYDHTLHLTLRSGINLAGIDFMVTPTAGSIEVELSLPAWSAYWTLTVSHALCRWCGGEHSECVQACDANYYACCTYFGCEFNCGPPWTACLAACAEDRVLCEADRALCLNEGAVIDDLLQGYTTGMSYTSATVEQVADVCVLSTDCSAVHPLVLTDATLNGFYLKLFPTGDPYGIGSWLNGTISALANWYIDTLNIVESFFVDNHTGEGVLINTFSNDIKNDGCAPDPAVMECRGAACSMTTQKDVSDRTAASILLYSLPLLVIGGLIFWRRKR